MKILLDECVPRRLKGHLNAGGHESITVPEAGLAGKTNGELLRLANERFEAFVTLDRGIPFQQRLGALRIRIVIIRAKSNQLW